MIGAMNLVLMDVVIFMGIMLLDTDI